MYRRALVLVAVSSAAGAVWGGIAGVVTVPFVVNFAIVIGLFWGICLSVVPITYLINKALAHAIAFWLMATTIVLLITLPVNNAFVSFGASTAAYIASCMVLSRLLPELPIGCEPHCPSCRYPLIGLPSDICPECGSCTDPVPETQDLEDV